MIKLADILIHNEYALYHDTRYGVAEQSMGGVMTGAGYAKVSVEIGEWLRDNRHLVMDVLETAAVFFGPFGLLISSAIGLIHAGIYMAEGDKQTAGLYVLFAMLPGVPAAARKIAPETMKTISKFLKTGNTKLLDGIDNTSRIAAEAAFTRIKILGEDGISRIIRQKTKEAILKNTLKIANNMVSNTKFISIISKIPTLTARIKTAAKNVLETAIKSTLKTGYDITKLGVGAIAVYNIAAMYNYLYDTHVRIGSTVEEYMKSLEAMGNFTQFDLDDTAVYLSTKDLGAGEIAKLADSIAVHWRN